MRESVLAAFVGALVALLGQPTPAQTTNCDPTGIIQWQCVVTKCNGATKGSVTVKLLNNQSQAITVNFGQPRINESNKAGNCVALDDYKTFRKVSVPAFANGMAGTASVVYSFSCITGGSPTLTDEFFVHLHFQWAGSAKSCDVRCKIGCGKDPPTTADGEAKGTAEQGAPVSHSMWFDVLGTVYSGSSATVEIMTHPHSKLVYAGVDLGPQIAAGHMLLHMTTDVGGTTFVGMRLPELGPGSDVMACTHRDGTLHYTAVSGTADVAGNGFTTFAGTWAGFVDIQGATGVPVSGTIDGILEQGPAALGQVFDAAPGSAIGITLRGAPRPQNLCILAAGPSFARTEFGALGTMYLDPAAAVVIGGFSFPGEYGLIPVAIPNSASLVGATMLLQALFQWQDAGVGTTSNLSNGLTLRVR